MATRSSFVLVHGGWHGAWCWERVVASLRNQGHNVVAPDLPAHGADRTPLVNRPYERYVPKICETLDSLDDRAILVGHSSGGMIITETGPTKKRTHSQPRLPVSVSAPGWQDPRDVMGMDTESILQSCPTLTWREGIDRAERLCQERLLWGLQRG